MAFDIPVKTGKSDEIEPMAFCRGVSHIPGSAAANSSKSFRRPTSQCQSKVRGTTQKKCGVVASPPTWAHPRQQFLADRDIN